MSGVASTALHRVVAGAVGEERATELLATVAIDERVLGPQDPASPVPRSTIAQALALVLFDRLCREVPSAAAYVTARRRDGARVVLDHAAVRTVDWPCGQLPRGQEQVTRLLRPLGYVHRETYDLEPLRMTGRSWAHGDLPEAIPQWFVSELHPDRFPEEFREVVTRVLAGSTDPLRAPDVERLTRLGADGALPLPDAVATVTALVACFGRRHPEPTDRDHDLLAARSAEMAWIATEGTTCNHWTDRVMDVAASALAERAAGRPIKDAIEVSASRRVWQTAHRAAHVERRFHTVEGRSVVRVVPGSFFELIERAELPDGSGLDLAFDAANAQGIFAMTRPEAGDA